jgi:ribose/xylose/arabinose/galactoside ABC-type transport system permease subunit
VGQSQAGAAWPTRGRTLGIGRLRTYGLLIAIVLLCVFFTSQRSAFASSDNIYVLLRSMASLAMIAFAQLLVIITGELDLSVGAVYGLAATTVAVLWLEPSPAIRLPFAPQLPVLLALVFALCIGPLIGWINAFFTTVVQIPSFVATLGMLSIATGVELLLGNASTFNPAYNVPPPDPTEVQWFREIGSTRLPLEVPIQIAWLGLFFVVFWVIRHRTLFGFRILAIGGNGPAAHVARLPVRRYKFAVFIMCGFMAGLAGILDFSYVGSVTPNSGAPFTFPVFAAVVIGGASLAGGRGTVFGTLLGAALLAVLRNGLAIMGVGSFAQLIVVGGVTIGAVTLDVVSQRAARRAELRAR